jgi:hypothetical protein
MYPGVPIDCPTAVRRVPSIADASPSVSVSSARDAEVSQHRVTVGEEDVLRLDVAVDHAVRVRGGERVRHLARELHGFIHRERTGALEPVAERLAGEEGRHVVQQPVARAEGEHREDVRVLDLRGNSRLALEAGDARLARELRRKHLYHHLAPQARVLGDEDVTHPTASQLADESVLIAQRALE